MSDNIFVNEKGFHDVRRGLRLIYKTACYDSKICSEKLNMNKNSWEKLLKKIKLYLPENFFVQEQRGHRKILKCVYDKTKNTGNYLCEVFRNKAFTTADIYVFINALQLTGIRARKTMELIMQIHHQSYQKYKKQEAISISTIKKILSTMEQEGYLKKEKSTYELEEDIWKDFSKEELLELYDYLSFIKNSIPLETPFYLLEQKLRLYLENRMQREILQNEDFLYEYNNDLVCVLDNEILLALLKAIYRKKYVKIQMDDMEEKEGYPLEVIHDEQFGDQYLHFYYRQTGEVEVIALCDMKKIKLLQDEPGKEEQEMIQKVLAKVRAVCQENWGEKYKKGNLVNVVIRFMNTPEVRLRVETEGQEGTIQEDSQEYFLYTKSVRNPEDMLPWIRSFSYEATVMESGEAKLEEILKNDWKEAAENWTCL